MPLLALLTEAMPLMALLTEAMPLLALFTEAMPLLTIFTEAMHLSFSVCELLLAFDCCRRAPGHQQCAWAAAVHLCWRSAPAGPPGVHLLGPQECACWAPRSAPAEVLYDARPIV